METRFLFFVTWLCMNYMAAGSILAQTPIVLRDLTRLDGVTVTDFDHSAIMLSNGSRLSWDQVLSAPTTADRQTEFDRHIQELGLPLFRLKLRIANADWDGAGEIAGSLAVTLNETSLATPDVDMAYLVHLASMKCRLQEGDRINAVRDFVRAAQLQEQVSQETRDLVGTNRLPDQDSKIQFSQEILPVWFDVERLEKTIEQLTNEQTPESQPSPGVSLYLASMNIETGQIDSARELLNSIESTDGELASWRIILESRIKAKSGDLIKSQSLLEQNEATLVGGARAVAFYYRGISALEYKEPVGRDEPIDVDRSNAMLTLLKIPALYGDTYRHLSAAALFQAAEIAKLRELDNTHRKLQAELFRSYPRTYHASPKTTQIDR